MASFFEFPQGFLWGSATSSHQVEGSNTANDWYDWEKRDKTPESGKCADSYNLFNLDIDLLQQLDQNAYRFSLEWSRIEPEQGRFDQSAINRYSQILSALKSKNIKTVLTLNHFTLPKWFLKKGGWLWAGSWFSFKSYLKNILPQISNLVDYWITINEPVVYVYNSYLSGIWPPGEKNLLKAFKVLNNLFKAHLEAYELIHNNYPQAKVSLAKHLRFFSACDKLNFGQNNLGVYLRDRLFNFYLLDKFYKSKALDFLAVNYYAADFVDVSKGLLSGNCTRDEHFHGQKNEMGWYEAPRGLFDFLIRLKKYNLPVIITENGTSEPKDYLYKDYLLKHLFFVANAIKRGVDVKGYFWWSLIDNYEWDKGFIPRFGLAAIKEGLKREPKPFSAIYKDICRTNKLCIT